MAKYLVTNIAFDHYEQKGTAPYEFPADINLIQDRLKELEINVPDVTAMEIYVRTEMFNFHELTYNYIKLDDSFQPDVFEINEMTVWDLVDIQTNDIEEIVITYDIPEYFIVNLSDDDIRYADNDEKQAIFEKLINNLPLNIQVHTASSQVCTLMDYCMHRNIVSPDNIADIVCDRLHEYGISDQKLNEVYDAVHNLASVLVKGPEKYM